MVWPLPHVGAANIVHKKSVSLSSLRSKSEPSTPMTNKSVHFDNEYAR